MDCREAIALISPHLDGALSIEENSALAEHLAGCESCARELSLFERLAWALREVGREEAQAPPELCGLVLGRLRNERRSVLARLPAAWRRSIAAAAAVLFLAGGSAWVTAGLNVAGVGKMIGLGNPAKIDMDAGGGNPAGSGGGSADRGDPGPAPGDPGGAPNVEPEGDPPGSPPGDSTANPADPGNGTGDVKAVDRDGKTTPPAAVATVANTPEDERVLLRSGMKATSTILKVAVDDLAAPRAQAASLAAGAGAGAQVFPEQSGGKQIVLLRLTVASDRASELAAELAGLGKVFDRQDESLDITSLYNETLVQYSDLRSRISSAEDAAEKQQLEAQAASYKRQLDTWQAEAGKRVITLWLEGR
jgi:hypothetical protein